LINQTRMRRMGLSRVKNNDRHPMHAGPESSGPGIHLGDGVVDRVRDQYLYVSFLYGPSDVTPM
jgi:hypothetical protein